MRKYKFILLLTVIAAVFFVLSWFVYDGIDLFFSMVYSAPSEKEESVEAPSSSPHKSERTTYTTKEMKPEVDRRNDMKTPDTRFIKTRQTTYRKSTFEKFVEKIFPEQLDYVLNPYTFFLILVLSILPIIGIFTYLIIYYLK